MRTVGPSSTASAIERCPRSSASGRTRASNRSTAAKSASSSPSKSWSPVTATRPVKGFTVKASIRTVRCVSPSRRETTRWRTTTGQASAVAIAAIASAMQAAASHRRGPAPRRIVGMAIMTMSSTEDAASRVPSEPHGAHSTWEGRFASNRSTAGTNRPCTIFRSGVIAAPGSPAAQARIEQIAERGSMPYSGAGSGPSSCRRRRMR